MISPALSASDRRPRWRAWATAAALVVLLCCLILASLSTGPSDVGLSSVLRILTGTSMSSDSEAIILELRLPRALSAVLVGSSLAVAGAILQGVTRNLLAGPGILGINSGAALFAAGAFVRQPTIGPLGLALASLAGGAFGATLSFGVAALSRTGLSPLKLALAGATVAALLGSLTAAVVFYFELTQDIAFWAAGSLTGVRRASVAALSPVQAVGLGAGLFIAPSVTVLALGDDRAAGLGLNVRRARVASIVIAVFLAGGSVSLAGPVGFVGLVVPHAVRPLVGWDDRRVIPCSALAGAALVVLADLACRIVIPPYEVPLGLLTALIGGPFFLYLARKGGTA